MQQEGNRKQRWKKPNYYLPLVAFVIIFNFISCQSFLLPSSSFTLDGPFPLNSNGRHQKISGNKYCKTCLFSKSRREAVSSAFSFLFLTTTSSRVQAKESELEGIILGHGQWRQISRDQTPESTVLRHSDIVPALFSTFSTRFILNYDESASSWWLAKLNSYSLMSERDRTSELSSDFGSLARSIDIGIASILLDSNSIKEGYHRLFLHFSENYGVDDEARRQILLLFSLLPAKYQPIKEMAKAFTQAPDQKAIRREAMYNDHMNENIPFLSPTDFTSLFPQEYHCIEDIESGGFAIYPCILGGRSFFNEILQKTAIPTIAGPLSPLPLQREMPRFSTSMYILFGISGAAGCALTHATVIPLDVVKTRMQTEQRANCSMLECSSQIFETQGLSGFFMGSQATIVGYLWYGFSVYPSYTFFKRWIGLTLLSPNIYMVHQNDVVLLAGALAAVIASLGLTPIEAARIRTVADPREYGPKGLIGTLRVIATENPDFGWKALYSGLPSLLTRQVIFGSLKFLAFERICDLIYSHYPSFHDQTWKSLAVSLVAGGLSGCLSSIVSQPADSILTFVAQNSDVGPIDGCQRLIERDGFTGLFRGLSSRCVWAGSIIAGQFLLYDVFRTFFGVNDNDITQIFELKV
jgi:solute carrier family 25 (mitochondrial phosphate transporter), member 3